MLAGGVFSWLVMMPAISFFGSHFATPIYPGTTPIADMDPSTLWKTYVRPMGAGAVAAAGLITLLRTAPTIISALARASADRHQQGAATVARCDAPHRARPAHVRRARRSRPAGRLMVAFLQFHPVPGAQVGLLANIAAALLVVLFGFLFVAVSARIVGIVGLSSSPVSGMTIATLMATTRHLPRQGLDRAGVRRAGHYHRRHCVHRGFKRRRHRAGPEDRLPHRRHALEAAGGGHGGRHHLRLFDRRDAQRHEQRRSSRSRGCPTHPDHAERVRGRRPEQGPVLARPASSSPPRPTANRPESVTQWHGTRCSTRSAPARLPTANTCSIPRPTRS